MAEIIRQLRLACQVVENLGKRGPVQGGLGSELIVSHAVHPIPFPDVLHGWGVPGVLIYVGERRRRPRGQGAPRQKQRSQQQADNPFQDLLFHTFLTSFFLKSGFPPSHFTNKNTRFHK